MGVMERSATAPPTFCLKVDRSRNARRYPRRADATGQQRERDQTVRLQPRKRTGPPGSLRSRPLDLPCHPKTAVVLRRLCDVQFTGTAIRFVAVAQKSRHRHGAAPGRSTTAPGSSKMPFAIPSCRYSEHHGDLDLVVLDSSWSGVESYTRRTDPMRPPMKSIFQVGLGIVALAGSVQLGIAQSQSSRQSVPALPPGFKPLPASEESLTTAQIAKKVSPSVVVIGGKTDSGDVLGSGFIVSKDGKIVTNLHVIRDMKTASVQTGTGEIFDSVSVVATDERRDLAVIRVAGFNLPVLELGDSDSVSTGDPLVIVGSPRGLGRPQH